MGREQMTTTIRRDVQTKRDLTEGEESHSKVPVFLSGIYYKNTLKVRRDVKSLKTRNTHPFSTRLTGDDSVLKG